MRIISGIYRIVNKNNSKSYIGSSKNIIRRWYIHKSALKNNRHHCTYLQRSWNKNGETAFMFEIITELPNATEDQLLAEELKAINEYLPAYNIGAVGGGDNLTNNPNRANIIHRITETLRHQVARMNDQERKDRWGRDGITNGNWRGGVSIYHCVDCHCEISYGRIRCMGCSKKGNQNPFYGRHHSAETKEKTSAKMKGRLPINTNPIILNGIQYKSQADAARQLGKSIGTISNWVRGKFKPQLPL